MADAPVTRLTDEHCWQLLGFTKLGRLATAALGVVGIRPVNYIVDGRSIVFRTAPGAKLLELSVSSQVAFEIDDFGTSNAWSVVATGRAAIVDDPAEIARIRQLPLFPWVGTDKDIFVRITVADVTGRSFVLTAPPA
jgi:uncharacterized protein